MTDYTAWVIELEEAKAAMIAAKKAVKSEAERKAKKQAALEIRDAIQEIEAAFAKRLALANAEGVPQAILRRDVLRTGDWGTWVKWRDLAEIEPERTVLKNTRAEKARENAIFFWNEDGDLVVKRASDGTPVEPVTFLWSTVRESNGRYIIDAADFADESRILRNDVPLRKIVEDAVRARVAEVGLDTPTKNG